MTKPTAQRGALPNKRKSSDAEELSSQLPDEDWLKLFRRRLLTWYRRHARDLPWRQTQDPYSVWISEVMLQQTQVETVIPYYHRFLEAFPNVGALAAAAEQDVLRRWEGLGYYRRARQLHRAAQQIVTDHDGEFPRSFAAVFALPGIGRYTAGAILSFACQQRHPILEANTIRLLSRLLAYPDDPTKAAGQRLLWSMAEHILPRTNVALLNQAVMELGSLVCTPREPACTKCPIRDLCAAYQAGQQHAIPLASKRVKFEDVREAAVVVRREGRVLLRQCQPGERWAGLWDFPRFELTADGDNAKILAVRKAVQQQTGITIDHAEQSHTLRHGVTRFRITLECYTATLTESQRVGAAHEDVKWIRIDALQDYPLSSTGRKISDLIQESKL